MEENEILRNAFLDELSAREMKTWIDETRKIYSIQIRVIYVEDINVKGWYIDLMFFLIGSKPALLNAGYSDLAFLSFK